MRHSLKLVLAALVLPSIGLSAEELTPKLARYRVTETRTAKALSNGFFNEVRAADGAEFTADCLVAWKYGDESQALKIRAGKRPRRLSFVSSGEIAAWTAAGALPVTRGADGRHALALPAGQDALITRVVKGRSRHDLDNLIVEGCYFLPETETNADWAKDCGFDSFWGVPATSPAAVAMLHRRGIGSVVKENSIRWCGGDGSRAGQMRELRPFTNFVNYCERLQAADSSGIVALEVCDEPNVKDIPYLGEVSHYLYDRLDSIVPMITLYPNYAQLESTSGKSFSQLGTKTYDEYIAAYCAAVPLPYIYYDFYVVHQNRKRHQQSLARFYDNFECVAKYARRTGREFRFMAQVNSHKQEPEYFTSENQLRFQANIALGYGATAIGWACYGLGWWTNNVITADGEKTEQFDKVKAVNAELHAIGPKLLKYRNVATHLVGFPTRGNLAAANAACAKGIALAEGTELVVGEFVARDPQSAARALYVVPAGDPRDERKAERTVRIAAAGNDRIAVTRGDGQAIAPTRGADGSLAFPLPESQGALIEFLREPSRTDRNLVRDDFTPDNWGGFVGWSTTSRGLIRSCVKRLDELSPNGKPAIRLESTELFDNTGRDGVEIMPSKPLKLKLGERYRASVYVRTKGIQPDNRCVFILHGRPWDGKALRQPLPLDTDGKWQRLEIEGVFQSSSQRLDAFLSVYAGRGLGEGAYIDIAEPTLLGPSASADPLDDVWIEAALPRRVTPVEPLLDRMSAASAQMTFYYPGELREGDEALAVRATARGQAKTVALGADHRATVDFGPQAPGPLTLKVELVGEQSGQVLATHEYRARVRAEVVNPTPIRRLNNFVGELLEGPLANGDYEFTLAEETWVYVGFSSALAGVRATIDGHEGVIYRPEERSETMRCLAPGPHVVKVVGVQPGTQARLTVRTVKTVLRQALHTMLRQTPNFNGYYYGEDYWRRLGMLTGFNTTSMTAGWVQNPQAQPMLDEIRRRGVSVEFGYGIGSGDVRRCNFEQYLDCVTNRTAYDLGELLQFDENSFLPHVGAVDKAHTSEIWWRAHAEGRQLNVFLDDAGTAFYSNPTYDIPELAAYLNSGDGRGRLYGEAYFRSVETRAELDRYLDFLRAQLRALRATNPQGPSHFAYLLCGWTMIGGWTPWYNTELDMRAMLGEMMRVFATDPEFADLGGISFSFPACWEDFWRFVSAGLVRYYCIEGETGDYAAQNGMKLFPGHSTNGDFLEGFQGWQVEAAESNAVVIGTCRDFGRGVQGRQYLPSYRATRKVLAGDRYAEFTRSAKAPNRLRQRLAGLEIGRVYQLAYTATDLEMAAKKLAVKGRQELLALKAVRPIVLEAEVKGAELIPDLNHTYVNFGKYGHDVCRTSRVVFRAQSPEAEVVFSDWKTSTEPGSDVGAKTALNAVMVHPYYYEDEAQLEILKELFRKAH